jgi:hypothetical protein
MAVAMGTLTRHPCGRTALTTSFIDCPRRLASSLTSLARSSSSVIVVRMAAW